MTKKSFEKRYEVVVDDYDIGKKGHKTQEFIESNTDLEKVLAANEEA